MSGIIRQGLIMKIKIHNVKAEPVNPHIQPKSGIIQLRLSHMRIIKIEVRLAAQEIVQIVLPAAWIPGPGAAPEQ